MSGEVVSMEAGRRRLQERLDAKERFKRRRVALGISSAPAGSAERLCCMCNKPSIMSIPILDLDSRTDAGEKHFCADHTPWPGGIDDLEIGE